MKNPKGGKTPALLPEDLETILRLSVAQQLALAESLESRAQAIRLHAHKLQARERRHGNGH